MDRRILFLAILVLSGCGEAAPPAVNAIATSAPAPAVADRVREWEKALVLAAELGDTPAIEGLLSAGARPDPIATAGLTPFLVAARGGHREAAEALLKAGANVGARGPDGRTALHAAVEREDAALAAALVQAGADPSVADRRGSTPLDVAAARGLVAHVEAWKGAAAQVDLARLIQACREGDGAYVKGLSAAVLSGARVNADGNSALHWAVAAGHAAVVKSLLEKGTPTDVPDAEGRSPLLRAAAEGRVEALQALLKAGADPAARGRDGLDAFCLAVDRDAMDILDVLRWTGPGAKSGLEAALVRAVETHRPLMLKHLLALGVDACAKDSQGRPVLLLAAGVGDPDPIRELLERGADPNVADPDGRTPLMAAAGHPKASKWQAAQLVALLLGGGADPTARDKSGRTATQEAAERGNSEVLDRLRRADARD